MDLRDKLKYAKGFFMGKGTKLHPMNYLPPKTIMWFAANPDEYVDQHDKSKAYTPDEIAQLGKKYFLIMIYIVKTEEEIETKEKAAQKLELSKQWHSSK